MSRAKKAAEDVMAAINASPTTPTTERLQDIIAEAMGREPPSNLEPRYTADPWEPRSDDNKCKPLPLTITQLGAEIFSLSRALGIADDIERHHWMNKADDKEAGTDPNSYGSRSSQTSYAMGFATIFQREAYERFDNIAAAATLIEARDHHETFILLGLALNQILDGISKLDANDPAEPSLKRGYKLVQGAARALMDLHKIRALDTGLRQFSQFGSDHPGRHNALFWRAAKADVSQTISMIDDD